MSPSDVIEYVLLVVCALAAAVSLLLFLLRDKL